MKKLKSLEQLLEEANTTNQDTDNIFVNPDEVYVMDDEEDETLGNSNGYDDETEDSDYEEEE